MARYQFESDPAPDALGRTTQIAHLIVRASGMVLLAVGLWIALAVIAEAWSLYSDPRKIERFADAIEAGSHLDRSIASVERHPVNDDTTPADMLEKANTAPEPVQNIRLTYFVAWVFAILLLMLIGRLAIAAVKVGGELVLYDLHIKRFVRELMREAKAP